MDANELHRVRVCDRCSSGFDSRFPGQSVGTQIMHSHCLASEVEILRMKLNDLVEAVNHAEHHTRRLNPDEYAVSDIHQQSVWEAAHNAAQLRLSANQTGGEQE